MSHNGFEFASPVPATTENGEGKLVIGKIWSTFAVDEFRETEIYDDAIGSVNLGALLTQGNEAEVPICK